MKRKTLITALIAIGFSLSGASHAAPMLITKPDGSKAVANVEGNKLMLRNTTSTILVPAADGTYRTSDGKTIIVQGGIIAAQSGSGGPPRIETGVIAPIDNKAKTGIVGPNSSPAKVDLIGPNSSPAKTGIIGPVDNKAKADIIAPMNQGPGKLFPAVQPSAPGMGSPVATQGGLLMQKNKPGNEVAPGSPGYKASTLGGQGPTSVQTTPLPQGTQSRASSKSPKGPSGPEGAVPPKQ